MQKQILALLLSASFIPIAPKPAASNPAAVVGASGCAASGVCGVVVGTVIVAGTLYYVVKTRKGNVRIPGFDFQIHRVPQPRPAPRPEVNIGGDPYNQPGVQEVHYVQSLDHCKRLFQRLNSQGIRSWEFRRDLNSNKAGNCILRGPGATDDRFGDPRYD